MILFFAKEGPMIDLAAHLLATLALHMLLALSTGSGELSTSIKAS
jgi:hypothetical protein